MPTYFFDTSALLKRYYLEPGTAWVQGAAAPRAHSTIYLPQLAQIETIAALRRVGRLNGDHPSYIDSLGNLFKRRLSLSSRANAPYMLIPITSLVVEHASGLCDKYWDISPGSLRSLDALHIASAALVSGIISDKRVSVTADLRMAAIAAIEGFSVINPVYPPRQ
jgi:predicted nucleic acid-binding protein